MWFFLIVPLQQHLLTAFVEIPSNHGKSEYVSRIRSFPFLNSIDQYLKAIDSQLFFKKCANTPNFHVWEIFNCKCNTRKLTLKYDYYDYHPRGMVYKNVNFYAFGGQYICMFSMATKVLRNHWPMPFLVWSSFCCQEFRGVYTKYVDLDFIFLFFATFEHLSD